MASTYIAYVPRKRLPTPAELNRALSSRGVRVKVAEEGSLDALGGDLSVRIDGNPVPITVEVSELVGDAIAAERAKLEAAGDAESEKRLTVLKTTELRFSFVGDGDNATWARDIARGLALLSCGAFENPADGRLLHFGY